MNSMERHIQKKLSESATAFLAGDKNRARDLLREAAHMPTGASLVENIVSSFEADRPWKTFYLEKSDKLSEYEVDTDIDAKFAAIISGNVEQAERYRDVVLKNIENLTVEVGKVSTHVSESVRALEAITDEALSPLKAISIDLASDLSHHEKALMDAKADVEDIESLARIYDSLASQWGQYLATANFVSNMVTKLPES